jgi:hypothetical protein
LGLWREVLRGGAFVLYSRNDVPYRKRVSARIKLFRHMRAMLSLESVTRDKTIFQEMALLKRSLLEDQKRSTKVTLAMSNFSFEVIADGDCGPIEGDYPSTHQ